MKKGKEGKGFEALNVPKKSIIKVSVDIEKLKAFAENSDEKTKRQVDIIIRIAQGEELQTVAKSAALTPQGIIKFRKAILKKLDGFEFRAVRIEKKKRGRKIKAETNIHLKKIKELHGQGLNNTEIAQHFNKTSAWVEWMLKKAGLRTNFRNQIVQLEEKVKYLHAKGLNNAPIAKSLKKSESWVSYILRRNGLKSNSPTAKARVLATFEDDTKKVYSSIGDFIRENFPHKDIRTIRSNITWYIKNKKAYKGIKLEKL
jgi:DNA-binding NarL/FixJ family response regulator